MQVCTTSKRQIAIQEGKICAIAKMYSDESKEQESKSETHNFPYVPRSSATKCRNQSKTARAFVQIEEKGQQSSEKGSSLSPRSRLNVIESKQGPSAGKDRLAANSQLADQLYESR